MAFDGYTKSLLHFNGVDQSQVFTDETGKVWTATGDSQLDTAQKVFGSASLRNPGNGHYLSTPFSADFNPGTGNYTIDFRIRWLTSVGITDIFQTGGAYNAGVSLRWASNNLTIYVVGTNNNFAWIPVADTWYHVAIIKVAGVYRAFVDGTQIGADWSNGTSIAPGSGDIRLCDTSAGSAELDGWIDEFRFSKGIARWTADFTPPWYEYGGSIFQSTSNLLVPTVTNLITVTASKFWGASTILIDTLYNEAWTGDGAAELPALTGTGTLESRSGMADQELPALTASASGSSGFVGNAQATLPELSASATGLTGCIATASAELPALETSASGNQDGHGIGAVTLPVLLGNAHGELTPAQIDYKIMAMNLRNFAVTEYENFGFNSFGELNGTYFGLKDDGIYPLAGSNDQGTDIDAEIKTGKVFIEHWRIRDVWSYGLLGGQNRTKEGRGQHSGFVDFTITAEGGVPLDLDRFEVMGDPVRRKKH